MLILDKLAELSADSMASVVAFTQSFRPRHPRVLLQAVGQKILRGLRSICVAVLKRLLPMFPWGVSKPGSAKDYLISSARLARGSFILGARVTPIVWRMSQNSRSRSLVALLVRVIFGRPDRRSRRG